MSYSFGVTAPTKAEAEAQVTAKMNEVVTNQPVHITDRDQALAAASAFLAILREPTATENVYVSLSGSIWVKDGLGESAGVNVSVGFQVRP